MQHAYYLGPDRRLFREGAVVQPHPTDRRVLLAQFDNLTLPMSLTHAWVPVLRVDMKERLRNGR